MSDGLTRRTFLAGSGALVLSFSLSGFASKGQAKDRALPGSLRDGQRLDAWLRLDAQGGVTVFTGKAELGQGIKTALAQIAADELEVDLARVEMVTADTGRTPDEGYTAGSMSIQQSGSAIRYAAAEARHILLELAAERLGVPLSNSSDLSVEDGTVRAAAAAKAVSYWSLVDGKTLERTATGRIEPKSPDAYRYVGLPVPRLDIPAKVFGEVAFVHDLRMPGMLHGRIVRPPSYGASLDRLDTKATSGMSGVLKVVRDGSFLGVIAEREDQAIAAAERLRQDSAWSETSRLPEQSNLDVFLRTSPAQQTVVSQKNDAKPAQSAAPLQALEADYFKPYIAHASIGPSCAVAHREDDDYTIWCHSQGAFPLRSALATATGIAEDRLRVRHMDGAGCYGHNGADDVAFDALLLARALPGRPVRVQWMREEEFRWEPFGPAMSFRLQGSVDRLGRIVDWRHEIWSPPHSTRPGRQPTLLSAWSITDPVAPAPAFNIPLPPGGTDRNSVPLYDLPHRVIENFIPEMPVRVSALRALGGYGNIFALESFMDELAAAADADPVAFRLRHLRDARARAVIERAADEAEWEAESKPRAVQDRKAGPARGRGVAFAQYKNLAAYFAVVIDVTIEPASGAIRVDRATAAVDAGQIINPDGLRNQIEGGIVQSLSWTLKEEVTFDRRRITSADWRRYPILTFDEAPAVEVHLIDRPDLAPKGAGEAAQGPTAAAIANAVFDAVRVRLRTLPLTRARVRSALASRPSGRADPGRG